MFKNKETTYQCENCHTKYNRSIQKAECPFCHSEFVIEQPFTQYSIPRYQPQPKQPSMNPYIQAPRAPYLNFQGYEQNDLVDMPNYSPYMPQRPSAYQQPFNGGFYGPSGGRPLINRDPMVPMDPMSHHHPHPFRGGFMSSPDDDSFEDQRFGTIQPPTSVFNKCIVCDERLKDSDDIVTYTCGHQIHAGCITSKHCDKCLSMFN